MAPSQIPTLESWQTNGLRAARHMYTLISCLI